MASYQNHRAYLVEAAFLARLRAERWSALTATGSHSLPVPVAVPKAAFGLTIIPHKTTVLWGPRQIR